MMNGLDRLTNLYSRHIEKFGYKVEDMEDAWKTWEDLGIEEQERNWKNSQLNTKERRQVFPEVTDEQVENMRRDFLQIKFEENIRGYYENPSEELPKEIRKIKSEYRYRFEDAEGISDEQIEEARGVPMNTLIETKRGFAKCPFHNEKTPSMKIDKNLFYCFGCNIGGDSIKFVMETKSLNFKQAIIFLNGR